MENIYVENNLSDNDNPRALQLYECQPTQLPSFMYFYYPKITSKARQLWVPGSRSAAYVWQRHEACDSPEGRELIFNGHSSFTHSPWSCDHVGGLNALKPQNGWFNISIPGMLDYFINFFDLMILTFIFCYRQAKFSDRLRKIEGVG